MEELVVAYAEMEKWDGYVLLYESGAIAVINLDDVLLLKSDGKDISELPLLDLEEIIIKGYEIQTKRTAKRSKNETSH